MEFNILDVLIKFDFIYSYIFRLIEKYLEYGDEQQYMSISIYRSISTSIYHLILLERLTYYRERAREKEY